MTITAAPIDQYAYLFVVFESKDSYIGKNVSQKLFNNIFSN